MINNCRVLSESIIFTRITAMVQVVENTTYKLSNIMQLQKQIVIVYWLDYDLLKCHNSRLLFNYIMSMIGLNFL